MEKLSEFGPEIINCEDEKIHLCGKIQKSGYIIVFDQNKNCVALSKNCEAWLQESLGDLLSKDLDYYESFFSVKINFDLNDLKTKSLNNKIDLYRITIFGIKYQISVYYEDGLVFLEFEKSLNEEIDLYQLQEVQSQIDRSNDVWKTLCDNFTRIVKFDRVMVYQFQEDNSGIVVAENLISDLEPVLGFKYPEFDIPAQARELYSRNHFRQTPNINATPIEIVGTRASLLNLSKSQIRSASPVHLEYLANRGVMSSASFSIMVENKLWGLICCESLSEKYITLDQRRLCLFLINYAVNKYIVKKQIDTLAQSEFIKKIELELKEQLFYSKNLAATLEIFADKFMNVLAADGLIIHTPTTINRYGNAPSESDFLAIKSEVDEENFSKDIYTTYAFSKYKKNQSLNSKDYCGIARINLDKEAAYSIYWFRKEVVKKESWAGEPDKQLKLTEDGKNLYYAPRTSFACWQKEVLLESVKWSEFDKKFLDIIYRIIKSSIIRKMEDFNELNQMLALINKRIEEQTEARSSASKKLDAVKKSQSYLKSVEGLTDEELFKYSDYILEATILVNDIITKTIDYSLDNPKNNHFNNVDTENFLNHIIDQAVELYEVENFRVHLGDLYPIKADKTLLYQLFMNLIFNAIKFSSKQELTNLQVYSVLKEDYVIYYIKDNGIGMESKERDGVFNIFKTLSNATMFEGHGVGLAIVKRIIQRLNAQISFETQLGIGTTFIISFPND